MKNYKFIIYSVTPSWEKWRKLASSALKGNQILKLSIITSRERLCKVYYEVLIFLNIDLLKYHILLLFAEENCTEMRRKSHKGLIILSTELRDTRLNDVLHKVLRQALKGGRLKFFRVFLFIASGSPRINVRGITRARIKALQKRTQSSLLCYVGTNNEYCIKDPDFMLLNN